MSAHGRAASRGALLRVDGVVIARIAVFGCDQTNTEAEYLGILAVLRHAVACGHDRIPIYGDSKLVVSQLNGLRKCKADNLIDFYEEGLSHVR